MKKYFVYELKKSLFVMCVLTVITTAIYVISVLTKLASYHSIYNFYGSYYSDSYIRIPIDAIVLFGGLLSVIIPIWKLRYLMKKRSVDLYYSLPLSHTRILAVKFIVGLIVLYASFTVAFWIGSILIITKIGSLLKYSSFFLLYLSMFIPMAVIYSLTSFIFTRANRFIDGIVFLIMTGMSLVLVVSVISYFSSVSNVYIRSYYFDPFTTLSLILSYFQRNLYKSYRTITSLYAEDWVGIILVAVLGIAACIGLFVAESRAKAENCEQISESFFGYRVMIPLYAFSLALLSAQGSYVLAALVAAAAYAVSVLYKRTPRIGWQFALIVGVAFLAGAGLSFIG